MFTSVQQDTLLALYKLKALPQKSELESESAPSAESDPLSIKGMVCDTMKWRVVPKGSAERYAGLQKTKLPCSGDTNHATTD